MDRLKTVDGWLGFADRWPSEWDEHWGMCVATPLMQMPHRYFLTPGWQRHCIREQLLAEAQEE